MSAMDHVDHVGSLVRPAPLFALWQARAAGAITDAELTEEINELIRDAVAFQEGLGLKAVTDGEFRRGAWLTGFTDAVEGFERSTSELTFKDNEGNSNPSPAYRCVTPLKRHKPIVAEDYKFLAGVSHVTAKVTIPSPSMYHLGLYDDTFTGVYGDRETYFGALSRIYQDETADLAAAGCRFVQLDEPPIALLCDPTVLEVAARHGCDPETLCERYIELSNDSVANRPDDMTVSIHLCRGNQSGRWVGDGGYAPVAERLFNDSVATEFLMEYDTPRAGDFAPLKYVPAGKKAYLGIVSTKDPRIESRDELLARIEEANRFAPIERLGITSQCGFGTVGTGANTDRPNPMTEDIQRAKFERMIEVAEAVWS